MARLSPDHPLELMLYTTAGCHLCEVACQLVHESLPPGAFHLRLVEIGDSDSLVERYGIRIPVLAVAGEQDGSQPELGWPFDRPQLLDFIAGLPE